jgi:ABC-type antimicrobial peptide transport system permease subunit
MQPTIENQKIPVPAEKDESLIFGNIKQFFSNKLALAGTIIVTFFILLAIFAPLIAPHGFNDMSAANRLQPPSSEHWFRQRYFFSSRLRCENFIMGWISIGIRLDGCGDAAWRSSRLFW